MHDLWRPSVINWIEFQLLCQSIRSCPSEWNHWSAGPQTMPNERDVNGREQSLKQHWIIINENTRMAEMIGNYIYVCLIASAMSRRSNMLSDYENIALVSVCVDWNFIYLVWRHIGAVTRSPKNPFFALLCTANERRVRTHTHKHIDRHRIQLNEGRGKYYRMEWVCVKAKVPTRRVQTQFGIMSNAVCMCVLEQACSCLCSVVFDCHLVSMVHVNVSSNFRLGSDNVQHFCFVLVCLHWTATIESNVWTYFVDNNENRTSHEIT